MPSRRLRVGFVGGGWVTRNRHLPAARAQPELELLGLVSGEARPTLEQERSLRDFHLRHFTQDLTASWFREEVEVAIIGTPPETHHELVMSCLEMGKHVLVEKPFAMTHAQAEEMIRAAGAAKRRLGIVHNFQFSRASRRATELLESGAIGKLRGLYGFQSSNHRRRLPSWYKELPMGLFTDESPHLLYLLLSFLRGHVRPTSFVAPRMAADDNTPREVTVHFDTDAEVPASLHMFFDGALSEWHVVLFGSKRTLHLDLFRDILIELPDDGRHESFHVLRTSWRLLRAHAAGFARSGLRHVARHLDYGNGEVFRRFTASVLRGSALSGISGEDGLAVVDLMEAIRSQGEAASSGRPRLRRA